MGARNIVQVVMLLPALTACVSAPTALVAPTSSREPARATATTSWTPAAMAAPATPTAASITPPPLVFEGTFHVGGYRLFISCLGAGSPTVVLDSGHEVAGRDVWGIIAQEVSATTRVCTYDRAGLGQSDPDPGPRPRTSQRMATELHTLLAKAAIPRPYVLVGAVVAGFIVQLYASQHPDEVVGMVLVNSSHEDEYARFPPPEDPQERERDRVFVHGQNPEGIDYEASAAQVRAAHAATPKRDIPVVVLTSGLADWPPSIPENQREQRKRI